MATSTTLLQNSNIYWSIVILDLSPRLIDSFIIVEFHVSTAPHFRQTSSTTLPETVSHPQLITPSMMNLAIRTQVSKLPTLIPLLILPSSSLFVSSNFFFTITSLFTRLFYFQTSTFKKLRMVRPHLKSLHLNRWMDLRVQILLLKPPRAIDKWFEMR